MSEEDQIVDAEDLTKLMQYIRDHSEQIFVRTLNQEGKWDTLALAALTAKQAIDFSFLCIARWFESPGYRPVRVRSEEEMASEPS